jgi:formylglycine-generating enzyme required for sulfatase activity
MTCIRTCLLAVVSGAIAIQGDSSARIAHDAPGLGWAEVIEAKPDPAVVSDASFREAIVQTGLPWRVRDKKTQIELLLVPAGTFVMGKSPGDSEASTENETPSHEVRITQPYYLGRYEVTQEQYASVTGTNPSMPQIVKAAADRELEVKQRIADGYTAQEAEAQVAKLAPIKPAIDARGHEWPANNLSRTNCDEFCKASGLRLPTEAEWEFACRAGLRLPRYGNWERVAWVLENSSGKGRANAPSQVGLKAPNPLGFYDMLGNVGEFVQDRYARYKAESQIDPAGPPLKQPVDGAPGYVQLAEFPVIRGGSWDHFADHARASARWLSTEKLEARVPGAGIRAARTP